MSTSTVTLLVDAANVVGSRPDGWWRDRAGAAARLVARLEALVGSELAGDTVERVVVVLEGRARAGAAPSTGAVSVRHAPGDGDDLLVELAGPGLLLVTADRELAARGRDEGARVVGPLALLGVLEAGCTS